MMISTGSARTALALAVAASLATTTLAQVSSAAAEESPSAAERCNAMTAAVYESTNPSPNASLLTTWQTEAAKAKAEYGFTASEGKPFKASRTSAPGLVPVHRLYNARSHDFLWTKSATEVRNATLNYGYADHGVDFYVSASGGTCLKPVYRYTRKGIHRYAVTATERTALTAAGWKYESLAFYGAKTTTATTTTTTSTATASPTPTTSPTTTATASTGPLSQRFYLSKSTPAWYAYTQATNLTNKSLLYQIAATPTSIWLGGRSTDEARVDKIMDQAAAVNRTPQFVLYAIPNRDCGGYAAGGLSSVDQYKSWVDSVRRGIAGRKAIVIVEPDAIGMGCLTTSQRADRITMLRYAMESLSSSNVYTYIHAGSGGIAATDVAAILKQVGIAKARGFALNVSSFGTTSSQISYGKSLMTALGMSKHFVIDTSRNGLGRYTGTNDGAPTWCNPPGRALGTRPTTKTASSQVDAYLWIKPPGESDGQCHDGDPAGWFQSYALGLSQLALDYGIISRWSLPS